MHLPPSGLCTGWSHCRERACPGSSLGWFHFILNSNVSLQTSPTALSKSEPSPWAFCAFLTPEILSGWFSSTPPGSNLDRHTAGPQHTNADEQLPAERCLQTGPENSQQGSGVCRMEPRPPSPFGTSRLKARSAAAALASPGSRLHWQSLRLGCIS